MMSQSSTQSIGKQAEDIAAQYLKKYQLNICDRNFRSRFGEIDIIATELNTLIFVEVRYRSSENILAAIETINPAKCQKIIMTSSLYLSKHKKYQHHHCRYDVITITNSINEPVIEWIKNAFQA